MTKPKNNQDLPVLVRADKFAAALTESARAISESLSELRRLTSEAGAAEINGEDADELRRRIAAVVSERETAVLRRSMGWWRWRASFRPRAPAWRSRRPPSPARRFRSSGTGGRSPSASWPR
jgi:hypothetical protein